MFCKDSANQVENKMYFSFFNPMMQPILDYPT